MPASLCMVWTGDEWAVNDAHVSAALRRSLALPRHCSLITSHSHHYCRESEDNALSSALAFQQTKQIFPNTNIQFTYHIFIRINPLLVPYSGWPRVKSDRKGSSSRGRLGKGSLCYRGPTFVSWGSCRGESAWQAVRGIPLHQDDSPAHKCTMAAIQECRFHLLHHHPVPLIGRP